MFHSLWMQICADDLCDFRAKTVLKELRKHLSSMNVEILIIFFLISCVTAYRSFELAKPKFPCPMITMTCKKCTKTCEMNQCQTHCRSYKCRRHLCGGSVLSTSTEAPKSSKSSFPSPTHSIFSTPTPSMAYSLLPSKSSSMKTKPSTSATPKPPKMSKTSTPSPSCSDTHNPSLSITPTASKIPSASPSYSNSHKPLPTSSTSSKVMVTVYPSSEAWTSKNPSVSRSPSNFKKKRKPYPCHQITGVCQICKPKCDRKCTYQMRWCLKWTTTCEMSCTSRPCIKCIKSPGKVCYWKYKNCKKCYSKVCKHYCIKKSKNLCTNFKKKCHQKCKLYPCKFRNCKYF